LHPAARFSFCHDVDKIKPACLLVVLGWAHYARFFTWGLILVLNLNIEVSLKLAMALDREPERHE
jgi:hypothetical protein